MLPGLILIGIALVLLIFYYIQKPYKYWKNKNVPHPPVSYPFGNVGEVVFFKKSLNQIYQDIYYKYKNYSYVGVYRATKPCILLRDPELVKEVLVKKFNNFHDNDIYVDKKHDAMFAKNPFASKGEEWAERRHQTAPLFTAKHIKEMYPLLEEVAKTLVKFLSSNPKEVDVLELCLKYTTDNVTKCALGLEANCFVDHNSDHFKNIKKILVSSFGNSFQFLVLSVFPSLAKIVRAKFFPDEAVAFYEILVNTALNYRNNNKIKRGDFLDSMNELQSKLGSETFSEHDITAHVLTFFADGTESSSVALTFTLYELALHPDIQENLRKDIFDTKNKHKGNLSYDAIQDMEYLDQVVNESFRKNPPFSTITKVCTEQTDLESPYQDGRRVTIDPGTPIIIPIRSIHWDSKYYANPELFDPQRFSKDNVANRNNFTYLVFGEGQRICLGRRFAITQIKIAIAYIIQHYEVKISKTTTVPYKIDPNYFLLAAEGGIRLDFHKRA